MMPAIFRKVEYKYMTNNMTTGKPAKLILQFMIPTCLGNIFQQFYNLADSVVAGRFIGVDALAAIGSTTSLIFLVIGWLNGLTSGFSIMVAQHFGAGKYERMRRNVAMSIYLCLAFVLVMTIALEILNYPILRLMNAPDGIIDDTAGYMAVIYAGLFATAAYNGLAAVHRDSHGASVFHHSHRHYHCTGGRQCLWVCVHCRFFSCGQDTKHCVHCVCGVRGNGSHLCGAEPGRRPYGPRPSGGQVHTGYDSGLERCDDSGVAAWLAALIPIVPYYFYKISRISRKETHGGRITADVI